MFNIIEERIEELRQKNQQLDATILTLCADCNTMLDYESAWTMEDEDCYFRMRNELDDLEYEYDTNLIHITTLSLPYGGRV